jgi:hypothetical protein
MEKINTQTQPKGIEGNVLIGLVIGIVIALIPSYYFYMQYQKVNMQLKNPNKVAQDQTKELLGKLSSLIVLPGDENPTIATVQDKSKLKDQPFFKNAQNGDKLIIYLKARKAILYRDATNKIIEFGPVTLQQNKAATPAPSGAVQPSGAATTQPAAKTAAPSVAPVK